MTVPEKIKPFFLKPEARPEEPKPKETPRLKRRSSNLNSKGKKRGEVFINEEQDIVER